MTPKISVFIATSLDGCIARPDGNLDWLLSADTSPGEPDDHGYAACIGMVDTLVVRHDIRRAHVRSQRPPSQSTAWSYAF